MGRSNSKPSQEQTPDITEADLKKWLKDDPDFKFEQDILHKLTELGAECTSGSSYEDPIQNKLRQYDIRACLKRDRTHLLMAVECKKLVPTNPLMILQTSRTEAEAYAYCIRCGGISAGRARYRNVYNVVREDGRAYKVGDPVGKSTVQLQRSATGSLKRGDQEVYEKWAQAVQSAHAFMSETVDPDCGPVDKSDSLKLYVVPILVVPKDTLWTARMSDAPPFTYHDPVRADRCPFLLERPVPIRGGINATYVMSHLEFMTPRGIKDFCERFQSGRLFD